MATEILPNVYWLEGGGNFYLCQDEDELILIDCGMPRRENLVWQLIEQLGKQPTDLKHMLITHADIDHVGSLAKIQKRSGAKVYAGAETAVLIQTGKSPNHMPRVTQFIIDHFMNYQSISAGTIEYIKDGDSLPLLGGLQVLATPGHTLDHHSFYSPVLGILFAGDALNTRRDVINRTEKRSTADQDAANQSAIRLIHLTPAIIACGHGKPKSDHSSPDLMMLLNQLRKE